MLFLLHLKLFIRQTEDESQTKTSAGKNTQEVLFGQFCFVLRILKIEKKYRNTTAFGERTNIF